ncbi:DUF3108 domain-containing protein [Pyruvatibacter sp.]|uniref:DUF3108 domain-containing protein n=1 Tax=Pyruvatibacter sp. TaxID=1981328 RepID=UPI003264E5E0
MAWTFATRDSETSNRAPAEANRNAGSTATCVHIVATAAIASLLAIAPLAAATQPDAEPEVQSELPATPETSSTVEPITLVYEFYAAGFHLATVETNATLTNEAYEISTKGQSSGIADSLLRARFESSAVGALTSEGPTPKSFRNFSDTRFGVRELEMTRATDGTFDVTAEPELEPHQAAALRSGLADGTVDPLTASLYSALRPANTTCTEKVRVFDGRRVFALAYTRKGTEVLSPVDESFFTGDTIKCNLRYLPLAGQTREWKLEQAKNPTPPIELWMAEFNQPNGDSDVMIPVRMKLQSEWGTALVHLTSVTMGGEVLNQASLQQAK